MSQTVLITEIFSQLLIVLEVPILVIQNKVMFLAASLAIKQAVVLKIHSIMVKSRAIIVLVDLLDFIHLAQIM